MNARRAANTGNSQGRRKMSTRSCDDIPSGMTPTQQAADQWENDNHDYLEGLPEDARAELESAIADEDWQGALDVMDANYEYGHGNAIDEFREKVVNKEAYDVSQQDAADSAYSDLIDALGENPELSTDEIGRELMDRAVPEHLANEARLLLVLDASEQRTLADLLGRLGASLGA